jgi:hypothetical protein
MGIRGEKGPEGSIGMKGETGGVKLNNPMLEAKIKEIILKMKSAGEI